MFQKDRPESRTSFSKQAAKSPFKGRFPDDYNCDADDFKQDV